MTQVIRVHRLAIHGGLAALAQKDMLSGEVAKYALNNYDSIYSEDSTKVLALIHLHLSIPTID